LNKIFNLKPFSTLIVRALLVFALYASLGIPIVEEWKALLFFIGTFSIFAGSLRLHARNLVLLVGLLLLQKIVVFGWPTSQIEIGENIFLLRSKPGVMEEGWPSSFREKWRELFLRAYPDISEPSGNTWQKSAGPSETYSFHPESLWKRARYSRRVDDFSFRGLYELRAGFVNDMRYNFWEGDMHRRRTPFWILLEPGANTVGGTLSWKGGAMRIDTSGVLQEVWHSEFTGQTLGHEDIGAHWYFAFFPEAWPEFRGEDPNFKNKPQEVYQELREKTVYPSLDFHPTLFVRSGVFLENLLALMFFSLMMTKVARLAEAKALPPLLLSLGAYLLIKVMMHYDWGKNLLALYPPHGGGDDGLVHESWGLEIVRNLKIGKMAEALRGGESVYYFTPGMRYFRALEKVFFGATNLGYTLGLMLLPVTVWGFLKNWLSSQAAFWTCAVFLMLPPNMNFSLSSYITLGRLGYPAPLATLFFLLSLWILFMPRTRNHESKQLLWFASGFSLFLAIFLRPNHAIPAGITAMFAVWSCIREKDKYSLIGFVLGLGFFFLLPIHNLVFGDKFAWITSSVSIALPIPWATYPQALLEFLKGSQSEAFRIASDRLWLIITTPTLVFPSWLSKTTWIGLTLRSLAFGVTLWCACRSLLTGRSRLFWLSAISLANFPFLLVMHYPSPRYIALGWDLCVCTALIYLFAKGNGDQKLISRSFK